MLNRFSILIVGIAVTALALAAGALGAVLIRPPDTAAAQASVNVRQLAVIGTGTVKAVPDTAIVQFGVQTDAQTATQALADNSAKMAAVVAKLRELKLADADIQTSNLSIWPQYGPNGASSAVVGYQASTSVSVTIRDVAQAGHLLEQVIAAGANTLSGISFTIADPAPLEATARAQAIADAKARASEIAQSSSVTLGELLSITELPGTSSILYDAKGGAAGAGAAVQPGEQSIMRQIQLVYALQ